MKLPFIVNYDLLAAAVFDKNGNRYCILAAGVGSVNRYQVLASTADDGSILVTVSILAGVLGEKN